MALRMIDFRCSSCGHEFEELVEATDGKAESEKCPLCRADASMDMDFTKRVHREGNRYRDVSWSSWNIA